MIQAATAEDFAKWEEKAQSMTIAQLSWSRTDAYKAAQAMKGHNPVAEGRYMDECMTYAQEMKRRTEK